MINEHDAQVEKFDQWVNQWQKAQDDGLFDNETQETNPQEPVTSFFGLVNTHPTTLPKDVDAEYWNKVYDLSNQSGAAGSDLLSETKLPSTEIIGNAIADTTKKKQSQYPPNPVRIDSGGIDQELNVEPLGLTFDEKDIQELSDMKLRLHELEDKLAASFGRGSSLNKISSQINSLKGKIDELSTAMSYSYPTDIAKLK